jgi:hypothetical protein
MEMLIGKHCNHLLEDKAQDLLGNLEKGLDVFISKHRQERFGPNVLTQRKGRRPFVLLLFQFHKVA